MRKETLRCVGTSMKCMRLRERVPKTAWVTPKAMTKHACNLTSESNRMILPL